MMLHPRLVAVLLFWSVSVPAQVELPKVSEVVEVRLVELDVIVTDRDGNPVRGLKAADFEVLEDGKPQVITNFSEIAPMSASEKAAETATTAEQDAQPRRFVVFVDTLSTHRFQRKRFTAALDQFLSANVRPQDEAMLISWNRRLKIVVPPTNDIARLSNGLKEIARESSIAVGSAYWFDQALDNPEERKRARSHARALANDVKLTARAVNSVLTRLAGVSGRKILLLVTEGLDMLPGVELLSASGDESDAINFLEAEELHSGAVIESIARTANAADVTVYGIHGAGLTSGMSVTTASPQAASARARAVANSVESLTLLANSTGGAVAANTNDFAGALETVRRDLSGYYSIGYRTSSQRIDRERKLEVRIRDPRYRVRSRRSFVERSREAELRDQVVANLYFPADSNEMGIAAVAGKSKAMKRNRVAVPIDIRIPMSSLAFTPDEQAYMADIDVFLASADSSGTLSAVQQLKHRIRVPRSEFGKVASKHYTYGIDLDLTTSSSENRVSVAVLDTTTGATGFAVVPVVRN